VAPDDAPPLHRRRLAQIAAFSLVCTTLLWFRTDHLTARSPQFALPWDHHMYIFMARHGPFGFHVAPYCWRVLAPAVVWASPFGVRTGFEVLTFTAIWIAGVAVWFACERLRFRPALAAAGMLLYFSLGYATKWLLFDFWLTDPLEILLVVVAVLLARSGRDVAFTVCLVVGVLAKESVIFAAPLFYTLPAHRPWDRRLALRAVAVTIPAVATLVALHLGIHQMNNDPAYLRTLPAPIRHEAIRHYTYGAVLHDTVFRRFHHLGRTLAGAVGAFGLLVPLLALVGLRRPEARSFALRILPFLVLGYVQLLFAYNTERLLVPGLAVVIPLAVWGVRELLELGAETWAVLALPGVFFAMQLVGTHEWEPIWPIQLAVIVAFAPILRPWRARRRRMAPVGS
jgi:hypothetical protein